MRAMAGFWEALKRCVIRASGLGWRAECAMWLLLIAAVVVPRCVMISVVPVPLWSNDSGSYVEPALRFLDGGGWISNERRGPTYSMMIAAFVGSGAGLWGMVLFQHLLGGACVLASALVLRVWFGRPAMVPIAAAGVGYGFYNLPIYVAHLVRVETLLLALLAASFGSLALALRYGSRRWAFASGLATGLAAVTKGLLGPYPLIALAGLAWVQRRAPKMAAVLALLFLVGMFVPKAVFGVLTRADVGDFDSESYAGIQLYGRVAQWTRMDGGIHPQLKEHIRPQVEAYRALEKRDNNLVIKRLIVPRIKAFVEQHPIGDRTLDRVCRDLAFEAIASQPGAFLSQAWHDLNQLLFRTAFRKKLPSAGDLEELAGDIEQIGSPADRVMPPSTARALRDIASGDRLEPLWSMARFGWLFEWKAPIWLTSLALPIAFFVGRGAWRPWLLAIAAFWYFNLLLFCTVGKPLNRYFAPFSPVMFWAMGAVLCQAWLWLRAACAGSLADGGWRWPSRESNAATKATE